MEIIKKITEGEVKLGEALPWPVYDIERALLLQEGTVVRTDKQLQIILEKGVYRGMTEAEVIEEEKKQDAVQPSTKAKKFDPFEMKVECANRFNELVQNVLDGQSDNLNSTLNFISDNIREGCINNANATLAAVHGSTQFSYSILHPLHTAILCELLMRRLNFTEEQEKIVINAALLMNIGMFELQDELFTQQTPLTDEQKQQIHDHPEKSVALLKDAGVNHPDLFKIILQHHERVDGDGYPAKLTGDAIHQGAKVVALADMYSAMITPRAYRKPIHAQAALKDIFTKRGKAVDDRLTQLLIREVGVYPPGSFVKLVNGDTAVVIKRAIVKEGRNATAPIVSCIISPRGGVYESPITRDSNREAYKIKGVVEPELDASFKLSKLWGF